jgi:hypothetical protein
MYQKLFEFAYFPDWHNQIKYLAEELAADEEWDFSDSQTKSYSILKNYLEFTFRRLKSESKITYTTNNKYACFNTGLVTNNYEDIFAFFEEYQNPRRNESVPFCFKAFLKESDREIIKHFSDNLPDVANYFKEPEKLIFNPKCKIIADIDHIIQDNHDRFPAHLQGTGDDNLRRYLHGAIEEIKTRVKTNYKLAVPQFFKGRIQLLLPLRLTPGSPNPDLALVVEKENDSTYSARTCLTLKMAYNNARLIVKPGSEWLQP